MVAAPASGQGKTTVTAALARHYRGRGHRVRVFKTGPDFLDPMILGRAAGAPVHNLDLWMGGEAHCRELLYQAAGEADLLLIEGVMGLFDGVPSSADLAELFGIPVLAVIDASAMAQSFAAVAHGLASYRPGLPFAGVFANRVAGDGHYRMLREGLPVALNSHGWLPREAHLSLPERHLGLLPAAEIDDLDARISRAAEALNGLDSGVPPAVAFAPAAAAAPPPLLTGKRIAVARDAAFAFLYQANLECLRGLGAELLFFSPLADTRLPDADGLYLPGGYPELHLQRLSANRAMAGSIRAHHADGRPIVAECGGMLYLLQSLAAADGSRTEMLGVIPGQAQLQERLANLGLRQATLPEGELRGHTFHYSRHTGGPAPLLHALSPHGPDGAEPVYREGRLTASYVHWYFPSNPETAARLFLP